MKENNNDNYSRKQKYWQAWESNRDIKISQLKY